MGSRVALLFGAAAALAVACAGPESGATSGGGAGDAGNADASSADPTADAVPDADAGPECFPGVSNAERLAFGLKRPAAVAVVGSALVWTVWGEHRNYPPPGVWEGATLHAYSAGTVAALAVLDEDTQRPRFSADAPVRLLSDDRLWEFVGPTAADWIQRFDRQDFGDLSDGLVRGADADFVYLSGYADITRIRLSSGERQIVPLPDGLFFAELLPAEGGVFVLQGRTTPSSSFALEVLVTWVDGTSLEAQPLSSWSAERSAGSGVPMELTPELVLVALSEPGIVAVPRAGGSERIVASEEAGDLLVHGAYLYWSTGLVGLYVEPGTPVGSTIKRLALDQLTSGASPEIIVDCQSNPAAIAIDGDTIYWVNHLDDGDVWRATLRDP